jgi:hypothetical protein
MDEDCDVAQSMATKDNRSEIVLGSGRRRSLKLQQLQEEELRKKQTNQSLVSKRSMT